MTDDELLPIGRFARASGLTIGALRHYDEEGVLVPADVDPATGYRRYRRDQLQMARAVAALRDLELSLPAIRALLDADDPATRATILQDERVRLEARTARLQRALHRLHMLSITADQRAAARRQPMPTTPILRPVPRPPPPRRTEDLSVPTPPPPPTLDPETHRALAAGLFNRSWDLLEIEDRTARQDAELIDTAHASAWHWRQVGNAANEARGHWMLRPRLQRARPRPGGACTTPGARTRSSTSAARASRTGTALPRPRRWPGRSWRAATSRPRPSGRRRAAELLQAVTDAEDRSVVEGDLAALPV